MKYKWLRRDVDLELLRQDIECFLRDQGFKTRRPDPADPRTIEIFGVLHTPESDSRSVAVITGPTSDGFEVELRAGEQARFILKLGPLISFLGGGSLLLKGYKGEEFYRKLEEKFWTYVEKKVEELGSRRASFTF